MYRFKRHRGSKRVLLFLLGGWLFLLPSPAETQGEFQYTLLEGEVEEPFNLVALVTLPPEGDAHLVFNYRDPQHYYYLLLSAKRVIFVKVREGGAEILGLKGSLTEGERASTITVTLQRRLWEMRVLANGRLVTQAYDDEFLGGQVGYGVTRPEVKVEDLEVQPLAALTFADDFMRQAGAAGGWEVLAGAWENSGPKSPKPNPELSANPFSYHTSGGEKALSVAGYWFWDDYVVNVAVKPTGEGAVGLAVRVQDPENYYLFRWRPQGRPEAAQLLRVQHGEEEALAWAAVGYEPKQWYRLTVQAHGPRLQAFVDGRILFRVTDTAFGQGKVGLYAEGSEAYFDDVEVKSWHSFRDDFSTNRDCWRMPNQRWQVRKGVLEVAGIPVPRSEVALAGARDWQNYVLGADVTVKSAVGVGLCFYYQDARNYYLFRWGAAAGERPYAGRQQLIKVIEGQETVLAEAPGSFSPGHTHRLKIKTYRGRFIAYLDNQPVCEAFDQTLQEGKIGLWVEEADRVTFDNVVVWFAPQQEHKPSLTERYTKEQTMEGWASAKGIWRPAGQPEGLYWHRGTFFGEEVFLRARLPKPGGRTGALTAILCGDGENPEHGYGLRASAEAGQPTLHLELRREGKVVDTADREGLEGPVELTFARRGPFLLAEVEGEPVLMYRDPEPLRGRQVGLRWENWPQDFNAVEVDSPQVCDYTFSTAPTDWYAERGVWEITDRWVCFPGWSWFGGTRDRSPILWSKRIFSGDLTVEVFAAIQMDRRDKGGYSNPSDLNLTLCGDGRSLDSGYSFIFAGWNNSRSAIWRRTEIVATNDQAKFNNPSSGNTNGFHRHWFYLRVERRGKEVRFSVDDQEIARYEDPNPLPGGRVALWTYNSGIVIARARIWYEQGGNLKPLPQLPPRAEVPLEEAEAPPRVESVTHPRLVSDFEFDLGEVAAEEPACTLLARTDQSRVGGRYSLQVLNAQAGNPLALRLVKSTFNAVQYPLLRFDYRLPPGLELNLYLRVNNQKFQITFTGPAEPTDGAKSLGRIENAAADGRWHRAEFDLLTSLREHFPNASHIPVEELKLAHYEPAHPYSLAGLGGTPWGVAFYLDNVVLAAPGGRLALLRWGPRREGQKFVRYAYVFDRKPDTIPNPQWRMKGRGAKTRGLTENTEVRFENLQKGPWYFHLRGQDPQGRWSPPVHYLLWVDELRAARLRGQGRGFFPGGVRGEYYDDPDQAPPGPFFTQLKFTRTDPRIDFTWLAGESPGEGIGTQYWSARWTGELLVPREGTYTFYLDNLDDAGRLYLDGRKLIEAWVIEPPFTHASAPVKLKAGKHRVKIEYHQGPASGSLRLAWSSEHFEKEVIPLAASFAKGEQLRRGYLGEGLKGEYYEDPDHDQYAGVNAPPPGPFFTRRVLERTDPVIDFIWEEGEAPAEGINAQYWSVRWHGRLLVPRAEAYTFYLDNLDDAGRIYVDGKLVLDAWLIQPAGSHQSEPVELRAGLHDIVIEYHNAMPPMGSIRVCWSAPSLPKEVIPACFLYQPKP